MLLYNRLKWLIIFAATASMPLFAQSDTKAFPGTVHVSVDATDVAHRIFRVKETVPVEPGPFTLWLPKWEPGTHSPTVPTASLAGLVITGNGKRIEWRRDTIDFSAFKLEVPQGVREIEVSHEFISAVDSSRGRVVMTPTMLNLQWIQMVLYPAGYAASQITYQASVTVPEGWKVFGALEVDSQKGNVTRYKPISFENLLDSPLYAGKYYKVVDLDPGAKIPVRLNIVADDPRFLIMKDECLAAHRNLVKQAYKLYNSQHYDHYDFLLALSKQLSGIGLEHHRSSENGVDTTYFTEWDPKSNGSSLLPHEYTHSWNGKFRRPADLTTPNYNVPMQDSLLWVYEGQTEYWGEVLAARSGIHNLEGARDWWAITTAMYAENRPGLSWRALQDTTNDPILDYRAPRPYTSWQLRADYYFGAGMLWLEADVKIRTMTKGQKSLDDFAKAFFSVDDGAWGTKTYTFDEVVTALNNVMAFDWASFLRLRLDGHGSLTDGMEAAGWRLVFKDKPSPTLTADMKRDKVDSDFIYSLGFSVDKDGKFTQVRWDSPAFKAGVAMGMVLLAVNDRQYDKDYLADAIRNAKTDKAPIKLLVKDFDVYRTVVIDYKGGLRYPYLERIEGKTDYLTPILTAK